MAEAVIVTPKAWYQSKTLWVNGIAAMAVLVQLYTGLLISGEAQGAILVVVNIILRLITSGPIEWGTDTNTTPPGA